MIDDTPSAGAWLKRPLRILFLEDNHADFELCLHELKKARLEVVPDIVQSKDKLLEKLAGTAYDIILADYRLPGWTGMDALRVIRECDESTPFILVTGFLGEGVVVDCLKQGVSDYVLKDRISRLPIAINKALEEKLLLDERKLATNRLRESEEQFRTLTETIASAVFIYHRGMCQYANHAAEIITQYSREELLNVTLGELIHPDFREVATQMGLGPAVGDIVARRYELKIITSSGEARWLDITSSAIARNGEHQELVTAFDITDRKLAEEEVRQLVTTDPLTGLANYRRLLDAFDGERERSGRTGRPFALVLLDLDNLKDVNDLHGHVVGSRALCRVGTTLRRQCRSIDIPARYGGDEFAIVLPETDKEAAKHLAHRVADMIQSDDEQPNISVSFGLAVCPEDGETFKDVLNVADTRLYSMKRKHDENRGSGVKYSRPVISAK